LKICGKIKLEFDSNLVYSSFVAVLIFGVIEYFVGRYNRDYTNSLDVVLRVRDLV